MADTAPSRDHRSGMNRVLARNIEVLREERARMASQATRADKIAEAMTRFTGSMTFVILHLVIVALWVAINLGAIPFIRRFDETFVILATAASVEAIFLSTFVLISQNRAATLADQRADLDLQINLLAEHEITQLVTLARRIAEKLDVPIDGERLQELQKDVAPETVLQEIVEDEPRQPER